MRSTATRAARRPRAVVRKTLSCKTLSCRLRVMLLVAVCLGAIGSDMHVMGLVHVAPVLHFCREECSKGFGFKLDLIVLPISMPVVKWLSFPWLRGV